MPNGGKNVYNENDQPHFIYLNHHVWLSNASSIRSVFIANGSCQSCLSYYPNKSRLIMVSRCLSLSPIHPIYLYIRCFLSYLNLSIDNYNIIVLTTDTNHLCRIRPIDNGGNLFAFDVNMCTYVVMCTYTLIFGTFVIVDQTR